MEDQLSRTDTFVLEYVEVRETSIPSSSATLQQGVFDEMIAMQRLTSQILLHKTMGCFKSTEILDMEMTLDPGIS